MQKKTVLHALAAMAVIGGATSLARALDVYVDITRPGPDQPAPYTCVYKYKVKGSRAKGSEKYHMSEGDCYVSDFGVSCSGLLEASRHDRRSFFYSAYAPVGNGTGGPTGLVVNFDSRRGTVEGTQLDRREFGEALGALDDDLGGGFFLGKRPPVTVGGEFDVERLKVKGKVRLRRGRLSGPLKFKATGTVVGGENDGKAFKAQLKTRLRNAEELQR